MASVPSLELTASDILFSLLAINHYIVETTLPPLPPGIHIPFFSSSHLWTWLFPDSPKVFDWIRIARRLRIDSEAVSHTAIPEAEGN